MFEAKSSSFGTEKGWNARFNLTEDSTYVYTIWNVVFAIFFGYLAAAMRVNSQAGHMSNIMFICNQFKEFNRTI